MKSSPESFIDLIDKILTELEAQGYDTSDWRRELAMLVAGGDEVE